MVKAEVKEGVLTLRIDLNKAGIPMESKKGKKFNLIDQIGNAYAGENVIMDKENHTFIELPKGIKVKLSVIRTS